MCLYKNDEPWWFGVYKSFFFSIFFFLFFFHVETWPSVQGVWRRPRSTLNAVATTSISGLASVIHRDAFLYPSAGPRGPNHLTSDGTDVFQGIHECVLVACPGDDSATEKSESRTRSLMQPTIPFVYLPPVVLTISGAPPVKYFAHTFYYFHRIYTFTISLLLSFY